MLKVIVWAKDGRQYRIRSVAEGPAKAAMDFARREARRLKRLGVRHVFEVLRDGDQGNCHLAASDYLNGRNAR